MSETTITITKAQLLSWLDAFKTGEDIWTSLKDFVAADQAFHDRAPPIISTVPTFDASMAEEIINICAEFGVTPYSFRPYQNEAIEVVFMQGMDPIVEQQIRARVLRAVKEKRGVECVFSIWDGHR